MSLEKIANTHLEALEIMVSDYINLKSNLLKKKKPQIKKKACIKNMCLACSVRTTVHS